MSASGADLTTHLIPSAVFDQLSQGHGNTLGPLRDGQRSKRLLLLHELQQTASRHAPSLYARARADDAFALLQDIQRRCPQVVDDLLHQPHVGAWAYHCLHRLTSEHELPAEELGHLGPIAAVAALRVGATFEVMGYARQGNLMFPTFGLAQVGHAHSWCRIRSLPLADRRSAVEVEIASKTVKIELASGQERIAGDIRWLPLRKLHSTHALVEIDVHLDDIDPFRGCGHLPASDRLDEAEMNDWQGLLQQAWSLLVTLDRSLAEAIAAGVASVVPLAPSATAAELSASCRPAQGAIAMTRPRNPLALALALVHEFQHTKLSALLDLVSLVRGSSDAVYYAPWRPDPRHIGGLLQGTYAYLGLSGFWDLVRRDSPPGGEQMSAQFELALAREQVASTLDILRSSGQLTALGRRFAEGIGERLSDLHKSSVAPLAQALAHLATVDNRTSWRLRNIRPSAQRISDWVSCWLSGRPAPHLGDLGAMVVDDGGPNPSHIRLAALRQRIRFPDRRSDDAGDLSSGDVLLMEGRLEAAANAYLAQLDEATEDLSSWAGLALVRRYRTTPASWALTSRPELVLAVHRALAAQTDEAPSPEDVASWIGAGRRGRP